MRPVSFDFTDSVDDATARRDVCVVVLGGSLAVGTGDPKAQGWVTRVLGRTRADDLRLTAYNLAVVGDTTAAIVHRLDAEAQERWAGHAERRLVVSAGPEDARAGISIARHRLNLANALDTTGSSGIRSFVVGPAPTGEDAFDDVLASYAEAQADVCSRRNVPFVDCMTPLRRYEQWHTDLATGDGLPGQAGYGLIAWLVLNNGWRTFMGIAG